MSTVTPDEIPKTVEMWRKSVKRHGQGEFALHQITSLKSASKIDEKQFLALRVIWPERKNRDAFQSSFGGLDFAKAKKKLAKMETFQNYLAHIDKEHRTIQNCGKNRLDLGPFAAARRHQLETIYRVRDTNEDDDEAPDEQEPRHHPAGWFYRQKGGHTDLGESQSTEYDEAGDAKMQDAPEPRDHHKPGHGKESSGESGVSEFRPSMTGSWLYEAWEDMPGAKKPTICESIVNNAAIQYLSANCGSTSNSECAFLDFRSPFEKLETLSGGSMEACTDGVLTGLDFDIDEIFAIIEVKPRHRRRRKIPRILWQESAEFVAWINNDVKHKPTTGFTRRLLIAQDQEEIFLCVAKYDEDYVQFLTAGDESANSFLEIQEYGPWSIRVYRHMEQLGAFIYAYCQSVTKHIKEYKKNRATE